MTNKKSKRLVSKEDIALFDSFIQTHSSFVIITHKDPDGDAVASSCALARYLELHNKNNEIQCIDKPLDIYNMWDYQFMALSNEAAPSTAMIFVDCGNKNRAGLPQNAFKDNQILNIDHHADSSSFGTINIIYPDFCSTTEIIMHLFQYNQNVKPENDIAQMLLSGLLYDTYYFNTENTDYEALQHAAMLEKHCNSMHFIKERMFKNQTIGILKLWGIILSHVEIIGSCIVSSYCKKKWLEHLSLDEKKIATEGFINHLTSLQHSKLTIFIKERTNDFKVSIRSNIGKASELAAHYGGGGHKNAAGATISKINYATLESFNSDIIEKAQMIICM